MLAQNFKAAVELGLTDKEFGAHIKVLGMLERGELRPHSFGSGQSIEGECFNMGTVGSVEPCGTAACIAGWVGIVLGTPLTHFMRLEQQVKRNRALHSLYFPDVANTRSITPAIGAIALRNFLTDGDPRWDEAMRGND